MYSIYISLAIGLGLGLLYRLISGSEATWGIGVVFFISFSVAFIWLSRRISNQVLVVVGKMQQHMQAATESMQKKINGAKSRPGINESAFRKSLEAQQKQTNLEALEILKEADALGKWNFLVPKQLAAIRLQLLHSVKMFDEADRFRSEVSLADPTAASMVLARIWMTQPLPQKADDKVLAEWEGTKVYLKSTKSLMAPKGSPSSIVYGTYAWMLLKAGLEDKAREVLEAGLKKYADPVLQANLDLIRNKNAAQCSNAGFAERWYALHIEEPPREKPRVQQVRQGRGGMPYF
ncbi:MAG: hypothetical protein RL095_2362 [Verrucomicrobiota bacterium]